MSAIHPDKTARRAVDACGGTFPKARNDYDEGWQKGHEAALGAAMDAVAEADSITEQLFKVVFNLCDHHEGVSDRELFSILPNHVAWAVLHGRAAIVSASGRYDFSKDPLATASKASRWDETPPTHGGLG